MPTEIVHQTVPDAERKSYTVRLTFGLEQKAVLAERRLELTGTEAEGLAQLLTEFTRCVAGPSSLALNIFED